MTIDRQGLRQTILSDAVDDHFGLYEVIWGLNTRYPHLPESEKAAVAIPVVSELLEQRLIELYDSVWSPSSFRLLSHEAAAVAIRDPLSWRSPEELGGTYVSFVATEAGKRVYYQGKS